MERAIGLLEAIPYLRAYAGRVLVVKAGGELLQQERWREGIARDVAVLHRLGIRVVLVHGGGPQLDAAADRLGLETVRVAGRRVTSAPLIGAAVMEWRGALSTQLVAALARHGERAVGLSGLDGGLIQAERRPPTVLIDDTGDRVTVDFGLVGDVVRVEAGVVRAVAEIPAIPVVTPLAAGPGGQVLNVNADTVAAALALALDAAALVLLTRAPGIQTDPADPRTAMHWTDLAELADLEADGAIRSGMRPKVAAIRRALDGGVDKVFVVDGTRPGALLEEVFTTDGAGTMVVSSRAVAQVM